MNGLLARMKNILIRPQEEWRVIQGERTRFAALLRGYVAVIATLPPVCAVLERLLFGTGAAGGMPIGRVLLMNSIWYFVILINMLIASAVITAVVFSKEPWWFSPRGLQLASFSFTPLFLAAIPAIVPRMNWLFYGAILYSFVLLYIGVRTMTAAARGKAIGYAAASFLAAMLVIGILDGIEYMLESFLTAAIFS